MGFGTKTINKDSATLPESISGDNPAVAPAEEVVVKPADEKLSEKEYITDTFHNATAVNTDRFPSVVKDLRGFASGHQITVTYYKEQYAETDAKGVHTTRESTHAAHRSILKIKNFEMIVPGDFSFNYDTDSHVNKIDVEALVYPGFEPTIGDRFLYEIEVGRFGLFQIIQSPARMTIRASTYHKVTFNFIKFVNEAAIKEIEQGLIDTAYFDKARFLNEPGALLFHNEVVELQYCKKQHARLINYFQSKFMDDQIMFSYMRPDGVYDPYVTDFLIKTLDFSESGVMATQLYQEAPFMDENIWRAFLDPDLPLESVPTSTSKLVHKLGSKSVLVTSLINKKYVKWIPSKNLKDYLDELINPPTPTPAPEGMIPSDPSVPTLPDDEDSDQILGDLLLHIHPHYTECPLLDDEVTQESVGGTGDGIGYILGEGDQLAFVSQFLLKRDVSNLERFHKLIDNVWKMPKINQFYLMPFLAYICTVVIDRIRTATGVLQP